MKVVSVVFLFFVDNYCPNKKIAILLKIIIVMFTSVFWWHHWKGSKFRRLITYHAQAQWLSISIRHSHSQSSESVFVSVITFDCEVFVYFAHFYTDIYNAISRQCWITYFFKVCSNNSISYTYFCSFSLVFQWSVSTSILNPIFLFCLLEVIIVLFNLYLYVFWIYQTASSVTKAL